MIFDLNQISNRDTCLLYIYRILRQPSDLLKAIYTQTEPKVCQIQSGSESDVLYKGTLLYSYKLDAELSEDKIPYLEFECENENTLKQLVDFIQYDTDTQSLYATIPELTDTVTVKIYEVYSIHAISNTLALFYDSIKSLYANMDSIREEITDLNPQAAVIGGRDNDLVEFYMDDDDTEMRMRDTGYHIASALSSQRLVNPTQELLSRLVRVLNGNIIIDITDGMHRVLDGFVNCTIFISGNGSWVFRDIMSTINIYSSQETAEMKFYNCSLVYFRHVKDLTPDSANIKVKAVSLYRTTAVGVQGELKELSLNNNSVYVSITDSVKKLIYVGAGCTFATNSDCPDFNMSDIIGNVCIQGYNTTQSENVLIMDGRTVGFNYNQHDFELPPLHIEAKDEGYVHITEGGDIIV